MGHKNRPGSWTNSVWAALGLSAGLSAVGVVAQTPALVSPMRIAQGQPGQVLVSDSRQDRIFAVDEDSLAPLWSFAVKGTPMAIGAADDLVLIGNASTHNVEVYRVRAKPGGLVKDLAFEFNLGHAKRNTPGTIQTPSDLAVDLAARLVFVVDSGERKVKVFDLGGQALPAFPAAGEPSLLSPTAIAIDPQRQEVLVSDYGDPNGSLFSGAAVAARIMIYTYGGQLVGRINGGQADGVAVPPDAQFERPQGLAVDSRGRLLMVESVRGQVFVFDRPTGAVVGKLGTSGDGAGELRLPLDAVLHSSGDVLVTNSMRGRIERLANSGGPQ